MFDLRSQTDLETVLSSPLLTHTERPDLESDFPAPPHANQLDIRLWPSQLLLI
jgi:hypothetical protein